MTKCYHRKRKKIRFVDPIRDFLDGVVYDSNGYARSCQLLEYLPANVAISPDVARGRPYFVNSSSHSPILTPLLQIISGDSIKTVSNSHEIPASELESVYLHSSHYREMSEM